MGSGNQQFSRAASFEFDGRSYAYYPLAQDASADAERLNRLPYSLKILLENALRNEDGVRVTAQQVQSLYGALLHGNGTGASFRLTPARLLLNDSSGLPLLADLAALREEVARMGGALTDINPVVPVDLVVDHSVMVDAHGTPDALEINTALDYQRNAERYRFLRWAREAFRNLRVVPPGTGISHQINMENLARCLWSQPQGAGTLIYPETLVGTDSHTTMINGIGILGWGVGGIEAGAALLGEPITMAVPKVVGCRLSGRLDAGVSAMDLALTLTEMLRKHDVTAAFVEFFGPGLEALSIPDRSTVANMAPEYGATMGFFPVDASTVRYLRSMGRRSLPPGLVEHYMRMQGLWHGSDTPEPDYEDVLELELGGVRRSLAGPKLPQSRVLVEDVSGRAQAHLTAQGRSASPDGVGVQGKPWRLKDASVVLAAITSCTNTANPASMLSAALLARNAVSKGLAVRPWVKTAMAPGSPLVGRYLSSTGLQKHLDALGFHIAALGCAVCMGNSGPLDDAIADAIRAHDVQAVAVLSGNRNFEGRIHPLVKASYLCSPALVVAYALAGTIAIDLTTEPLGVDLNGQAVYLADIWPSPDELQGVLDQVRQEAPSDADTGLLFEGDHRWQAIEYRAGDAYEWNSQSTYIRKPPFFDRLDAPPNTLADLHGARAIMLLGDGITTDHISPVATITPDSAAGQYLRSLNVDVQDFNSFASRRINHEVMLRATFANIRIVNEMVPERAGGWTRHVPSGDILPVHEAAARYAKEATPLIVIAGKDYGMGSSRDWAAKGVALLGVRAIIAEGFERIHRANLIGMGILPLQFLPGDSRARLGLTGSESFDLSGLDGLSVPGTVTMTISRPDGSKETIGLRSRLDIPLELEYYKSGGILRYAARRILARASPR